MIASLKGQIISKDANSVIIEVGGVGYRVMLSNISLSDICDTRSEVFVYTSMIVREDNIALYGFITPDEQQLFEKLITVSGVGPKVALSALSAFSVDNLKQVIAAEDIDRVSSIPGIGKKTASRIILELKSSFTNMPRAAVGKTVQNPVSTQAKEALLSMGFSPTEIEVALDGFEETFAGVTHLDSAATNAADAGAWIRYGLKRLGAS